MQFILSNKNYFKSITKSVFTLVFAVEIANAVEFPLQI